MSPRERIEAQLAWLCHVNAPYVQTVTLVMAPVIPAANDEVYG